MFWVAVPPRVMLTTVSSLRVLPPCSVAVTVMEVASSSSPIVLGLTLRVMSKSVMGVADGVSGMGAAPPGVSSSSVIVVVTVVLLLSRLADGPPPPEGLLSVTVKVSSVSSTLSSVVDTVNVLSA